MSATGIIEALLDTVLDIAGLPGGDGEGLGRVRGPDGSCRV